MAPIPMTNEECRLSIEALSDQIDLYANLLVRKGVSLRRGQELVLQAPVERADVRLGAVEQPHALPRPRPGRRVDEVLVVAQERLQERFSRTGVSRQTERPDDFARQLEDAVVTVLAAGVEGTGDDVDLLERQVGRLHIGGPVVLADVGELVETDVQVVVVLLLDDHGPGCQVAQTLVILGAYILWYRKTSQEAEDMMNIVDKRRMAYHYKNKYILISVAATGGIALAAVVCMLLNILFAGIAPLYCYTSVLTMFVAGNLVLYLSIRFWGLPNAVTGIY